MAIIRQNSVSGINSITAQSNAVDFYESDGSVLSIGANISGNVTGDITGNVTGDITSSGISTFDVITGVSTIGVTTVHLTGINDLNYPTAGSLSNRNMVINGAMQVSVRGTSSTSTGYKTIDRMRPAFGQISVTQSQQTLTGGSPYDEGFRYFFRFANTSPTSANNSYVQLEHRMEAQNIAQSGWKYKDSSSSIVCSFWARSSLAGTYYAQYRAEDVGNFYFNRSFTLAADTWTKIEQTIPGHSSLVFDNNTDMGFDIVIVPHYGTNYTDSGVAADSWFTRSGDNYFPDYAQDWGNTSSATFDVTGLQLEVGSQATPFEHRTYADDLAKCQRYFHGWNAGSSTNRTETGIKVYDFEGNSSANQTTTIGTGSVVDADDARIEFDFPVNMRAQPSIDVGDIRLITGSNLHNSSTTIQYNNSTTHHFSALVDNGGGMTAGQCVHLIIKGNGYFYLDAEI
tara:strand:+ start:19 stop:1386 length:1368 start_codon:yes stop_codon:yes gene_type:complete